MKITPIVKHYLELEDKFSEKYKNPVILYQVGSFYELYATKKNKDKLENICKLLNMIMTKKDKKKEDSPYMAGFPDHSLEKYKEILLNNNYTVIIVDQYEEKKGIYKRKIKEIITPGTNYNSNSNNGNFIAYIYIEKIKQNIYAGISLLDIINNDFLVKDFYLTDNYQEIIEFIEDVPGIKEIYINGNSSLVVEELSNELKKGRLSNIVFNTKIRKKEENINEVINFLLDVYPSLEEDLFLLRNNLLLFSIYHILKIIKEINPYFLSNVVYPEIIKNEERFHLANHSALQLNIIDYNENEYSLSKILNTYCSTSIGKRYMYKRLLHPYFSKDKLIKSYEQIEKYISFYPEIEPYLRKIYDIERLTRKIDINKIIPYEMNLLYVSLLSFREILRKMYKNNNFNKEDIKDIGIKVSNIINFFEKTYNLKLLENITNDFNIVLSFLEPLIKDDKEILNILNEIKAEKKKLKIMNNFLNKNNLRIEKGKDEYFVKIPLGKKDLIEKAENELKALDISYEKKALKSGIKFNIKEETLYLKENQFVQLQKNKFENSIELFKINFRDDLKMIINKIKEIDFYKAGAKIAVEMSFVKPKIKEEKNGSFLYVKNIRHPIVEYLGTENYVGNDIFIDNENKGYLIYGINSSGKSTLMKSVGVNLIMAQAGLFVSADSFEFYPFKKIFTRILGNDKIYNGESSFEVEMKELREILEKADKYSIVLGDELAKGTETVSAISIVSSGIERLIEKEARLIFSTHLHELSRMDNILSLPLKICHLEIKYDRKTKKILYERKLKNGSGRREYGIEVAEAMGLDDKFIKRAYEIRNAILMKDDLLIEDFSRLKEYDIKKKPSKYNSKIKLGGVCPICKKRKTTEVHHIIFQQNFNEKDKRKNNESNLIPICTECHDKIHKGLLKIKKDKNGNIFILN